MKKKKSQKITEKLQTLVAELEEKKVEILYSSQAFLRRSCSWDVGFGSYHCKHK